MAVISLTKGDEVSSLLVLLDGEIEVFSELGIENGARTIIHRKRTGALLGASELLGGQQYHIASAKTLRDSKLGVIHKDVFQSRLRARPQLLEGILSHLSAEANEMKTRLSTLSLDAYGRLRFCLNSLARYRWFAGGGGIQPAGAIRQAANYNPTGAA